MPTRVENMEGIQPFMLPSPLAGEGSGVRGLLAPLSGWPPHP
jgi:hypothetical protein